MDKLECDGWWWVPEAPSRRVYGSLAFEAGSGCHLNLNGSLSSDDPLGGSEEPLKIILGVTQGTSLGSHVTLVDCTRCRYSVRSPGASSEEYQATFCYVGAHLASEEEFAFSSATTRFAGLQDWLGLGGIETKPPGSRQEDGNPVYELQYMRVDGPSVSLGDQTVHFRVMPRLSYRPHQVHLEEDAYVQIECTNRLTLQDWVGGILSRILSFLTFAVDRSSYMLSLSLSNPKDQGGDEDLPEEVHVYFDQVTELKPIERIYPPDALFLFSDLARNGLSLDALLESWIRLWRSHEAACTLFFAEKYRPSSHSDSRFFITSQVCYLFLRTSFLREGVPHRARPTGCDSLDAGLEFDTLASASRDLGVVVARTIGGCISRLVEEHERVIGSLFSGQTREFMEAIDTALTGFMTWEDKKFSGPQFYVLTEKLDFLFLAALFSELGVSGDVASRLLNRNRRFRHVQSLRIPQ